jgi:hypothetical protein
MENQSFRLKFKILFKKIGIFLNNNKEKILAAFLLMGLIGLIVKLY